MNAKQLHEIAIKHWIAEYGLIVKQLEEAANKGDMKITIEDLSEGLKILLNRNGFVVTTVTEPLVGSFSTISFSHAI